jgi:hypothetical protein
VTVPSSMADTGAVRPVTGQQAQLIASRGAASSSGSRRLTPSRVCTG